MWLDCGKAGGKVAEVDREQITKGITDQKEFGFYCN